VFAISDGRPAAVTVTRDGSRRPQERPGKALPYIEAAAKCWEEFYGRAAPGFKDVIALDE